MFIRFVISISLKSQITHYYNSGITLKMYVVLVGIVLILFNKTVFFFFFLHRPSVYYFEVASTR